jgi:two-component system, OmpR family, KDP operon response regulator KdpE
MRSTRSDDGRGAVPTGQERATPPPAGSAPAGPARPAPIRAVSRPADPEPAETGPARVLIVEDEPALLRALRIDLRARGYEVLTAATGRDALTQAARWAPDVVLLDLGLPDGDGTGVITKLRAWSQAPVIVLSGRTSAQDKIGALDAGANDYVTKPFSMDELLARLRAVLRREDGFRPGAIVTIGRSSIDLGARTVTRASGGTAPDPATGATGERAREPVRLTRTEWRLLEILLRSPGQLIPASRLLTEVWGAGNEQHSRYLRFHMAGLRRKLEDDPPRPRHLLTEPGMGYRYQP